jgi:hypothetical protein
MQGPQDDDAFGIDPFDPDADMLRNGAAAVAGCGHMIRLRVLAELFDPQVYAPLYLAAFRPLRYSFLCDALWTVLVSSAALQCALASVPGMAC